LSGSSPSLIAVTVEIGLEFRHQPVDRILIALDLDVDLPYLRSPVLVFLQAQCSRLTEFRDPLLKIGLLRPDRVLLFVMYRTIWSSARALTLSGLLLTVM